MRRDSVLPRPLEREGADFAPQALLRERRDLELAAGSLALCFGSKARSPKQTLSKRDGGQLAVGDLAFAQQARDLGLVVAGDRRLVHRCLGRGQARDGARDDEDDDEGDEAPTSSLLLLVRTTNTITVPAGLANVFGECQELQVVDRVVGLVALGDVVDNKVG